MHSSSFGRLAAGGKWLGLIMLCAMTASCTSTKQAADKPKRSKEYFAESVYGVKASPRMVTSGPVPKGGGRYLVGKPYVVKGKTFVPKENPAYDKVGIASWYGDAFHGRMTANGELYDKEHLSAAHPTMPLPSYARVTNVSTGSSVIVRVNDRGPFHQGRIIDLSRKSADMLDMAHSGTGEVRVQYIGPARMDGHDMPYLMASYVKKGNRGPVIDPAGQIATGVMVASNDTRMPTPSLRTALAGTTPSGGTAGTLDAQLAAQSILSPTATEGSEVFAALPDWGPVPTARPHYVPGYDGTGFASAYAAENGGAANLAFDAILVRNEALTERSILSSVAKGGIRLSNSR
ncbi:septal ring lytic transglycosylase RlpA family protein [Rhizobium sp. G187]|uniref:septal ring lytic transglycosylase RlpA family protein n=1 Tax=Rhizobium sp. G187 TaxID=3451352 RepID=UPI003EE62CAC